jgi:hypothetical protein
MFLDRYKIDSLTFQIQYAGAYELWDNAGAVAKEITKIWPDLELAEAQPQQQTLIARNAQVQTGFKVSTIILSNLQSIDRHTVNRLTETYKTWRIGLSIEHLTRLSTRAVYSLEYKSLQEANAALRDLHLVNWPKVKMFDQPETSWQNVPDVSFRFEDEKSFSFLRFRTEQIKLETKSFGPFNQGDDVAAKLVSRLVIDFDRGLLGSMSAPSIMMDKWFDGFQHVLRRDLEKLFRVQT